MQIVGKGIAKGVTTGDGKQFASEVGAGFDTMGNGIGQGLATVVDGTVSGVFSVGRGLFSGVRTVGKGIGDAFTGQDSDPKSPRKSPSRDQKRP